MQILIWTYTATDNLAWSNTTRLFSYSIKGLAATLSQSAVFPHWCSLTIFFLLTALMRLEGTRNQGKHITPLNGMEWNSAKLFISWDRAWKEARTHTCTKAHEIWMPCFFPPTSLDPAWLPSKLRRLCISVVWVTRKHQIARYFDFL